jgi:hypothetical protein
VWKTERNEILKKIQKKKEKRILLKRRDGKGKISFFLLRGFVL